MEGMIGWILLIPGLYFLIFGRVFESHGFIEIPSDAFFVRIAGVMFIFSSLLIQIDFFTGILGIFGAIVLLVVAIVIGMKGVLQRRPDVPKKQKT